MALPTINSMNSPFSSSSSVVLKSSSSSTEPEASNDLPLVEKYRPKTFDEICSHKELLSTLDNFISQNKLPHLLFHGPPGTGKTTTILACARKMYGAQFGMMVLEV